jgi:hypothetical protein
MTLLTISAFVALTLALVLTLSWAARLRSRLAASVYGMRVVRVTVALPPWYRTPRKVKRWRRRLRRRLDLTLPHSLTHGRGL